MTPNEQEESQPAAGRSRRYLVWVALLALVLVPFVIIEGPGAGLLGRLGLTDRDEPFTELYFPDPTQLPRELAPGDPLVFDFSIRNDEGAPTTYRWEVRLGSNESEFDDSSSTLSDSGELRLDDGESGGVHLEVVAPAAVGPTVVGVVLLDRTEEIHFPLVVEAADSTAD